ncbi:MAG: RagB/SusD family nutrient uptake outer membrane protein [Muribaculaceae bacterium]|nr:RagB/SusD family nutrient uptake outer membrane protein [Muribaculaceae bacterium]
MKLFKSIILCGLGIAVLSLSSCDDMLSKSERTKFELGQEFWNNANQVASYSNVLYGNYVGYGTGGGAGWFYFKSLSDDQVNPSFDDWMFTTVPGTSSYWSDPYTEIRRCNYMLTGLNNSTLIDSEKNYYIAVGRLNRAWQYYQLVRMYGDVILLDQVILDPVAQSEIVYGPRTDRDQVMDFVLNDLDFAIQYLGNGGKNSWSKDMALAMKSDICLFEGTYCKYRTVEENGKAADANRAQKYLNESLAASQQIMSSGKYSLTANYGEVYNSLDLSKVSEIIFFRNYVKDQVMHSTADYTASSSQQRGISKDAVDAFLFLDGKPRATTSLSTDDHPVLDASNNAYSIANMLSKRDKRLGVLLDPYLCFKGHGWVRANSMLMTSSTGYNIAKYDNTQMEVDYRINTGKNYTDAPIYWLAVIYLNYAEAKAELGNITQSDLDISINLLQARAGLPAMSLNPAADPANNMGVSNLLWEIRRARRCELMADNWYRYWDLIRWHQLELLDTQTHPNINRGAYLAGVVDLDATFILDANGYIIPVSKQRTYDKKYYLCPIPSNQITLSKGGTKQNPGW